MASDMMDIDGYEREPGECEWEYEYHENETEDFYVVLDIPTGKKITNAANIDVFAPMVQTKPKKPRPKPTGRGRGRRNSRASQIRGGSESRVAASGGESLDEDESVSHNASNEVVAAESVQETSAVTNEESELPPSEFQLMDLNSDNPIISYGGSLYSCQWASSIGSDLLFMKKPTENALGRQVLHSFDDWDLVAISAAKLIASPATFQRRQPTSADVKQVDTSKYESETKALQADFIKRLADIKTRMGEPIGSMLTSIQPIVPPGEAPTSPSASASHPSPRGRGAGRGAGRGRGRARGRGRGRGRGTATSAATVEAQLDSPGLPSSVQPRLAPQPSIAPSSVNTPPQNG